MQKHTHVNTIFTTRESGLLAVLIALAGYLWVGKNHMYPHFVKYLSSLYFPSDRACKQGRFFLMESSKPNGVSNSGSSKS